MSMHPWERARSSMAGTLGLIMGASGIIIASLNIKNHLLKTIFLTLGMLTIILLGLLFLVLFSLAVRDYADQYQRYTRRLFGISWLRY